MGAEEEEEREEEEEEEVVVVEEEVAVAVAAAGLRAWVRSPGAPRVETPRAGRRTPRRTARASLRGARGRGRGASPSARRAWSCSVNLVEPWRTETASRTNNGETREVISANQL